jgi:hypothetical protein
MLILPLYVTHQLLSHPVAVFDVVYSRDQYGASQLLQEDDRTIRAGVQPAGDKLISILPEGATATGVVVVHTDATVSAATNFNGGIVPRQTYVRHNGDLWKLHALQIWAPHNKINRYLGVRFVDVDGAIT